MNQQFDVVIIGAGAAGLMCAITAGKRGRSVLVIDHSNKVGKKILMSGGGRCNFTNYYVEAENYLCENPHFVKSALAKYTQWDFISLVENHSIPYHEKSRGQLFCDNKAKDILHMLLIECDKYNVEIRTHCTAKKIKNDEGSGFRLKAQDDLIKCSSLVIASGGNSIPKMGASDFGIRVALQFGMDIIPQSSGLVPLLTKDGFENLAGVSLPVRVNCDNQNFLDDLLFTHKGLSGPAILQISSYWKKGQSIQLDLLPELDLARDVNKTINLYPSRLLKTYLSALLPKRLVSFITPDNLLDKPLKQLSQPDIKLLNDLIHNWVLIPTGNEGYKIAEVTLGGLSTNELSSKTMESSKVPGLYFIGEVMDVTGHLGGYNFQWAWSSGFAAGSFA